MPRPRPGAAGLRQSISCAASSTVSAQRPSAGVSPGMNASPGAARLRSRSSSGSRPSVRAASSMFDSPAQICCGLPKPRKAVDGTVWDSTLRATMRTAGTR